MKYKVSYGYVNDFIFDTLADACSCAMYLAKGNPEKAGMISIIFETKEGDEDEETEE